MLEGKNKQLKEERDIVWKNRMISLELLRYRGNNIVIKELRKHFSADLWFYTTGGGRHNYLRKKVINGRYVRIIINKIKAGII